MDSVELDLQKRDREWSKWYDRYLEMQEEIQKEFKDLRTTYQLIESNFRDVGEEEIEEYLLNFLRGKEDQDIK